MQCSAGRRFRRRSDIANEPPRLACQGSNKVTELRDQQIQHGDEGKAQKEECQGGFGRKKLEIFEAAKSQIDSASFVRFAARFHPGFWLKPSEHRLNILGLVTQDSKDF